MTNDPNASIRARIEGRYIEIAENVGKCIFCDLKEKYVIKKGELSVLTVNLYPYINGQLLVIPKRHIERYGQLNRDELIESDRLIKQGMKLLQDNLGIKDIWLILREGEDSGKTVKHLHWNIIPYSDALNTWHYQEISLAPIDLATRLRGLDK